MRKDTYSGTVIHCVMCMKPIPPTRKKDAVTCSPECTVARKNYFRSLVDQSHCRYCNRPSTPEMRVLFNRFAKWMRKHDGQEPESPEDLGIKPPAPQEE
jgi:hypothetical protein